MIKVANEIWIIFDPLDGPHLFKTAKAANRQYKAWLEEAEELEDVFDSFWDMSKPTRYTLPIC